MVRVADHYPPLDSLANVLDDAMRRLN